MFIGIAGHMKKLRVIHEKPEEVEEMPSEHDLYLRRVHVQGYEPLKRRPCVRCRPIAVRHDTTPDTSHETGDLSSAVGSSGDVAAQGSDTAESQQ